MIMRHSKAYDAKFKEMKLEIISHKPFTKAEKDK